MFLALGATASPPMLGPPSCLWALNMGLAQGIERPSDTFMIDRDVGCGLISNHPKLVVASHSHHEKQGPSSGLPDNALYLGLSRLRA